jgi:nucleoside-diphosphate-sugar epimerase
MRIFVTGATGFVGSAVVGQLVRAGHQVFGLARSDAGARALTGAGVEVVRGTLGELDVLARAAAASEGVIHTAHDHDFVNVTREVAAREDLLAIEAMGEALSGTGRPFIVSTGMSGRTEVDAADLGMPRHPSEAAALALAARGVRSGVVRLPPSVHGDGDHALVPMLIAVARARGVSAYIGEGANRWPAVHRLDAALLYRLALEKGVAGTRHHAVAEEGVPTRAIAEVIGRRLNLPVVARSSAEAIEHFGFLGHFFGRDLPASSARTRAALGWTTSQPGLIEDLEHGTYFG